jgi:cysteine desulfurase
LGAAGQLEPGRLLISAVEHPAVVAAAQRLVNRGWQLQRLPVDGYGRLSSMRSRLCCCRRPVWSQ